MSKYNYKNKYSDDDSEDDTVYKSYRDKFPKRTLSLNNDFSDTEVEEKIDRTIRIKEFDMNSIPPHDVKDNSGVKIVVIGKPGCFSPGTQVLLYDGTTKLIEEIQIGDKVMGDDGNSFRTVQQLFHDFDQMYEIHPKYGSSYTVNQNHPLVLKNKINNEIIEISVRNYLEESAEFKNNYYCFRSSGISCWKNNINDAYNLGYNCDKLENNLKISNEESRIQLLAGFIDRFGIFNKKKGFQLSLSDKDLINNIIFIARSLGFSSYSKDDNTIFIEGNNLEKIPTKTVKSTKSFHHDHLISSFHVIDRGYGEFYGFELDGNKKFILSNFEIVHNTGKSSLIQDIMLYKSHICPVIQVFSGTEDSNHFYSEKCPPLCVYNKYDESAIENFVKRQKIARKYLENPWAMQIIDDCTDDPKSLAKPIIQAYYKNGRHWKMIHILSLQYCLDIKPAIRSNIDYTFILRETNLKNRVRLHENYAGCIDNFQDFCDIMDQITEDYTALVINNRVQSNKIEDCIFWYKANPHKIPPNWRFGHPSAWEFNNERFDPQYVEPVVI